MNSIYQRALGSDFARLHPQIQRRFGLRSDCGTASIGSGVMETIWHGSSISLPFLYAGTRRHIMFPESGVHIPFTVENYAYRDAHGRETVSWIRTFTLPNCQRRFDAYMIYSTKRQRLVDYLGTHQHLAVDLALSVDPRGGLRIRSGRQRFYEHFLGFRFPSILTGVADVCEWYDDSADCFRISVDVTNPMCRLFGYRGHFRVQWIDAAGLPEHARPQRLELRE